MLVTLVPEMLNSTPAAKRVSAVSEIERFAWLSSLVQCELPVFDKVAEPIGV